MPNSFFIVGPNRPRHQ